MNGPIVVGIDGTDTASRALTAGIDLAKMYDQPLHVVCGYPMEQTRECGPMTERRVPMTTPPWVSEVLGGAEARARNAGVRVSVHGGFGRGSDAIIVVDEAVSADRGRRPGNQVQGPVRTRQRSQRRRPPCAVLGTPRPNVMTTGH